MQIRFSEAENESINELVRLAWAYQEEHENELFLIPERNEDELLGFVNDEPESELLHETDEEIADSIPLPIDLTQLTSQREIADQETERPTFERLLIAVDSGIVYLGEFVEGALACAVRGAAVCLMDESLLVLRYNTGPILIDRKNMLPLFKYMGNRLGSENLYLARLADGSLAIDDALLGNANQIQDRFRNFVERMIQEEALGILTGNQRGILMLDGALPAGTYDTPVAYMRAILERAAGNHVDVIAVSKKTKLRLMGKPITAVFDDDPSFVGYAPLKELVRQQREQLVKQRRARGVGAVTLANELYAVRFGLGPPAATFRVDVHNSDRSTPEEVIINTMRQCQIHGCYPRPLIDAHQYSSFFYQDVQALTAEVVARTGAEPKEDQSMGWMFEPFGALGK